MKEIFLILAALAGAPEPAPEFRAPIGGETAAAMLDTILAADGETITADPELDFNGDGVLSIADFCGASRRHYISTHEHTEVTVDRETVAAIAEELYPDDTQQYFYYEIDFVDGSPCRKYELTSSDIVTIDIYFEFDEWQISHRAEINPYTETITIYEEA